MRNLQNMMGKTSRNGPRPRLRNTKLGTAVHTAVQTAVHVQSSNGWLGSLDDSLAGTRISTLLAANIESSSAYNFALTDFTAMMSTDGRQLIRDIYELEILATELEDLLIPITVLNWEDVLNSWVTLMELCGKFHGSRSQAILRQLFDDETLQSCTQSHWNGTSVSGSVLGRKR